MLPKSAKFWITHCVLRSIYFLTKLYFKYLESIKIQEFNTQELQDGLKIVPGNGKLGLHMVCSNMIWFVGQYLNKEDFDKGTKRHRGIISSNGDTVFGDVLFIMYR